jgi:ectoine hydroxylase-related dioxygenase (phytanoyl-CoA dioxygenase family)
MVSTPEQRQFFADNGYILIPELFSRQEIDAVMSEIDLLETERMVAEAGGRNKRGMVVEDGRTARLQFDVHRTETRFALLCRHPRLAGMMQELMGLPLYIHHSKLAFKAPFTGSVQYWHQDYGYWIATNPRPEMGSCMVMLDEHMEDNACIQALAGSHRDGVVEHETEMRGSTGDGQRRIPAEALFDYCRRYPRRTMTGKPGSIFAWHCNTMHASSHNVSEHHRRGLIVAFNAVGNVFPDHTDEDPFTALSARPVELSADNCLL